jgi:hypothetical protein
MVAVPQIHNSNLRLELGIEGLVDIYKLKSSAGFGDSRRCTRSWGGDARSRYQKALGFRVRTSRDAGELQKLDWVLNGVDVPRI